MTAIATEAQGTRRPKGPLAVLLPSLCALCVSVASAGAAAVRPDRALYDDAKAAATALAASKTKITRRAEWDAVIQRYRKLLARYPQSGYADNALLAIGDLQRQMAIRFAAPKLNDDAIAAYRSLVEQYPSSSLGEVALWNVFELARASGDRRRVDQAARAYLDAFPDAARARDVRLAIKKGPVATTALPSPPPAGLTPVFNLRFWSGETSTRIVVDVEKPVKLRHDRVSNPDRLWVDLFGARLHPNLKDRKFPVGDGLLEQVRIGQNRDDIVRIVLDFKEVKDYSVFYLEDPTRLVIDVRSALKPMEAAAPASPPAPPPAQVARATPPPRPVSTLPSPSPSETPVASAGAATPASPAVDAPLTLPTHRLARLTPPEATPVPAWTPRPVILEGSEPRPSPSARAATASPGPPQPPQANRAGSYSLARQLGLGARRIVIDPGHGGHDTGAIGPGGLLEKDLVLDVAQRLEKRVKSELGAETIMTRGGDDFVPLEERTAIANSRAADLFLSVHANSSRNPTARGIETYFLNFAVNPHGEEVAARENAISAATLKDLQGLVKAIALNSKIDESRDFAASVQEAMVSNLKPRYAGALDRGVHTAPFYVLIGANMPSVLAEIAFVSNPEEERVLRTDAYREQIAESLFEGVKTYLEGLNRTQTRQLTGSLGASRVAVKKARR